MLRSFCTRTIYCALKQLYRPSSATPALPVEKHGNSNDTAGTSEEMDRTNLQANIERKQKSPMVAAAFASLKHPSKSTPETVITPQSIDERILSCKTPEALLTLFERTTLNRKQALKIVTTLSEWSVNGIAEMSTIETDPRFVSLCQLLGKPSQTTVGYPKTPKERPGDLSLILDVTGDDEAAKKASTLTLPQMVKVLSTLAIQKKRSVPLLRTLTFGIADSKVLIDMKKGADVFYALATLNYPDDVVMGKICNDLCDVVPVCEKSAIIGSISTSLGRLRYKNERLLESITDWVINNPKVCRNQEFVSILITLAIVNHYPLSGNKFFEILLSQLSADDLPTASTWLDVVWSLVVFGKATCEHYRSVLSQSFIQRILTSHGDSSTISWKRKLLNVNAAAKLDISYNGPKLEENNEINVVPLVRSKEKQQLVTSVLDALSNMLPSAAYLRNNIDSKMGFLIDGECRFDAKMTPLPLIDKKTGQTIAHKPGKGQRIALMCWDYHDNTRGKLGLTGANALNVNLLQQAGYRVLSVSYNEYNIKDKLSERIQYIEKKLKLAIRPNS